MPRSVRCFSLQNRLAVRSSQRFISKHRYPTSCRPLTRARSTGRRTFCSVSEQQQPAPTDSVSTDCAVPAAAEPDSADSPALPQPPLTGEYCLEALRECRTSEDVSELVSTWIRSGAELSAEHWRPVLTRLSWLGDFTKCEKLFDKLRADCPHILTKPMYITIIRDNFRTVCVSAQT